MAMPGVDTPTIEAGTSVSVTSAATVAAESYWLWDSTSRRYRVTRAGAEALGQRAGTYVGQSRMVQLRDAFIAQSKVRTNALAAQIANGDITLQQWQMGMREVIKDTYINEYMLGAGGRNAMTQSDWGRVGQMVREQYEYVDRFARDIADGRYTEAGIAARARMYPESASQAYERGNTESRGMPQLPAYPGDGSTQCLSNCKCRWLIKETDDAWECTWKISPAENCPDCLDRAQRWAPLMVPKATAATRAVLMSHLGELAEHGHD